MTQPTTLLNRTDASKMLIARRFERCLSTYDHAAVVQRQMACHLTQLIERTNPPSNFAQVLELGCGTGLLTELLLCSLSIERLILNDIIRDISNLATRCRQRYPATRIDVLPGDMEQITLPENQDLITTNAALQWSARPDRMLQRLTPLLRPGGLLALTSFGPDNLQEMRTLTGNSLSYLSLEELQQHLGPNVEILNAAERRTTLSFPTALDVLRHLKQTGANALQSTAWSPRKLRQFCNQYESHFGTGNGVCLTYHPLVVVARRIRN